MPFPIWREAMWAKEGKSDWSTEKKKPDRLGSGKFWPEGMTGSAGVTEGPVLEGDVFGIDRGATKSSILSNHSAFSDGTQLGPEH